MEVEIAHDTIAVGDRDSYDLRFFDREGNLQRVVRREFEYMVASPSQEERQQSPVYARSWLKPPLPLGDDLMMAKAFWTDPVALEELRGLPEPPSFDRLRQTGRTSFDFFDAEGRYLASVPENELEFGDPDEVDAEGRLYAAATDPFPHVRRYRVIIDEG